MLDSMQQLAYTRAIIDGPPGGAADETVISVAGCEVGLTRLLIDAFDNRIFQVVADEPAGAETCATVPVTTPVVPEFTTFTEPTYLP